jgi:hypothetical protein
MKLIISTHFFFLSKIVKAFLLIKCHAKGFARERGHSSIKTTTVYTHLTKTAVDRIQSPLDRMVDIKGKKKLEE